jgi:hypothetical protein
MFKGKTISKKQTLWKRLESLMVAVTFAEANEHDLALEMLEQKPDKRLRQRPRLQDKSRKDQRPVLMA